MKTTQVTDRSNTGSNTGASAGLKGLASIEAAYRTLLSERPGVLASESGGELAWLKKARTRDAERWQEEGIPTRRDEKWRYTSLSSIVDSELVLARPLTKEISRDQFPRLVRSGSQVQIAAEIVFYNGVFVESLSTFPKEKGVSVIVLSELFNESVNNGWTAERKKKFKAFQEHVEASDSDRENVFAAMNTSFMQDGVVIHLDKGVVLDHPIIITHLFDSGVDPDQAFLPLATTRVFASLDSTAQASLIEFYAGRNDQRYFTNSVSDVRLEEGARLTHCQVQLEGSEAIHIGTTRVHQKRDSFCESFQFSFGSKLSRHDLHVTLEGAGADAVVDGLYLVRGRQHVDNHTSIEHVVGHTTSEQIYKGILDDESRAVFNGRVVIHPDAQKSNSSQLNNNLVLSQKAEVDTKPELDIYADDVKAAHGATVGQLDPEHIFYLQARAIPKEQAISMLSRGFAQDIVYRIRNSEVRSILHAVVDEQFSDKDF